MAPSKFYFSVVPLLTYCGPAGQRKHNILMVPFNSALKNYIEKSGFYVRRMKTLSFCPSSHSGVGKNEIRVFKQIGRQIKSYF